MVARKPRVVIVGAGMAGLSAAYQLQPASCAETSHFDLTVLEASHRIGGRICTTEFGGDQVELGATWIHGIEGSPVYNIAQQIGALKSEVPWERQDGFPGNPVLRAEGGLIVGPSVIDPVENLYKKLMTEVRGQAIVRITEESKSNRSIGAFLRERFSRFLSQQINVSDFERLILSAKRRRSLPSELPEDGLIWEDSFGWSLRSLQDGIFSIHEYMERILTAVNSLNDLDLDAEKEYLEYPGEHITIGKGYLSVVKELARSLPAGTLQFGKKVEKFFWNHSHHTSGAPVVVHCEDGSVIEADHVIVTVSLGVLKGGTQSNFAKPIPAVSDELAWSVAEESHVCKSIGDLRGRTARSKQACQLFEPPLPSWKLEAISRLGFGVVNKLFLLLEPSEEEQLRSHIQFIYAKENGPIPWWMKKTYSICPIYKGSSVLLCWFAGEEALEMEGLSDDEVVTGVMKTLARFGLTRSTPCMNPAGRQHDIGEVSDSEESSDDGEIDGQPGSDGLGDESLRSMFRSVLRSSWGTNPLFQGSYSYVATGSSGCDIDTLAEPLPKLEAREPGREPLQLLFAGEATERHFYSTTHGAYLSGVREANRLLNHYGLSRLEPV